MFGQLLDVRVRRQDDSVQGGTLSVNGLEQLGIVFGFKSKEVCLFGCGLFMQILQHL